MPWCDTCQRWHSPNALTDTGECPVCGEPVAVGHPGERAPAPSSAGAGVDRATGAEGGEEPAAEDGGERLGFPWHFKLLVGSLVVYLGWRAVQGFEWIVQQF